MLMVSYLRGSLSAIFNIDLDLEPNHPMFASMEHMHMNRNIFNINLDLDTNLMLHRSEHRVRSRSRLILKITERLPLNMEDAEKKLSTYLVSEDLTQVAK